MLKRLLSRDLFPGNNVNVSEGFLPVSLSKSWLCYWKGVFYAKPQSVSKHNQVLCLLNSAQLWKKIKKKKKGKLLSTFDMLFFRPLYT